MKRILLIIFISVLVFSLASAAWYYSRLHANASVHKTVPVPSSPRIEAALKEQAVKVLPFIKKNNYNTDVCFLVNMNIASGANRFFVYDLRKDSVSDAGLVTHGRCNEAWLTGRKYDNKIGCGCTSLGKYRIGKLAAIIDASPKPILLSIVGDQ